MFNKFNNTPFVYNIENKPYSYVTKRIISDGINPVSENSSLDQTEDKNKGINVSADVIVGQFSAYNLKSYNSDKMSLIQSNEEIDNPKEVKEAMEKLKNNPTTEKMYVNLNNSIDYKSATIELKPDKTMLVSYTDLDKNDFDPFKTPKRLIRKNYDKDGKEINTLVIRPLKNSETSDINSSFFEVLESDNNGILRNIGNIEDTPYGQQINQEFTSCTGTKSEYKLTPTKTGNSISYKITDKNGNVLYNLTRDFEKVDENHNKTTINDLVYETEYNDKNIVIKKINKNGELIDSKLLSFGDGEYIQQHYYEIPENIIGDYSLDKSLIDLYKEIPGDFLYKLATNKTKIRYGEPTQQDACYTNYLNTIFVSKTRKNNPFTLAHEIGHSFDYNNSEQLTTNPTLQETLKDSKDIFKAKRSSEEQNAISYLLMPRETTAESIAILSGLTNQAPEYAMRSVIFQKEFADYIAKVGNNIK